MPQPAPTPSPEDIARLSFEDAMAMLDDIVRQLESGQAPLEASIELYALGSALKAHCEAKLKSAEEKVEKILARADGTFSTAPLDGQ